MAKIIVVTSGLTGILNASFELVDRLSKAGHEVICAAPYTIKEKAVRQGIDAIELPPLQFNPTLDSPTFSGATRYLSRLRYMYKNWSERIQKTQESIYPGAFVKMVNEQQPDLLIIDIELHEFIIKTHALKIPFLLLNQFFSVWRSPGLPYIKSAIIPGRGLRGSKMSIALHWLMVRLKRRIQFMKLALFSGYTDRRSALLHFAKKENFPFRYIGDNLWPGPFLYDELPVICMTEESLEFPHTKRPDLHYIGPVVFAKRKDPKAVSQNNFTLENALQHHMKNNTALIYCSMSTLSKGNAQFLKKLIRAVASEQKKWTLVISTGKSNAKSSFGELPINAFVFSKVPQLEILAKADCSINHGGIHTINECIHFKVPILIYSGKKSDQNGNAARVAYHQIGLIGDSEKDEVEDIRKKIKLILMDQTYRNNIHEVNKTYLENKENQLLERVVANFIQHV